VARAAVRPHVCSADSPTATTAWQSDFQVSLSNGAPPEMESAISLARSALAAVE
jgi:hypothetical protein